MLRQFFKRYVPTPEQIGRYRALRPFAALIGDPALWVLSRRNTAKGFGIGLFAAWLPLPLQTLAVLALTLWRRVNLPVAILASFVSNPITFGPMMVLAYLVGSLILQQPPATGGGELGLALIWQELGRVGLPLLVGCLTLGLLSGITATVTINIAWRITLMRLYRRRRARRRLMGIRFRRPRKKRAKNTSPTL
jgi:uncharacterized protein (DUF2062 family)